MVVDQQQSDRGGSHGQKGRSGLRALDTRESAELQRIIVGAAIHELGSIASALALRATLPASAHINDAERWTQTARVLADQLRHTMRLLELTRESAGRSTIAPGRSVDATSWEQLLQRVAHAMLPRTWSYGTVSRADGALAFAEADASVAAYLVLAALRHSVPRRVQPEVQVSLSLHGGHTAAAVVHRVQLTYASPNARYLARLHAGAARSSRWQRYSERLAAHGGWTMRPWATIDDQALTWSAERTTIA